ncbi:MAG: hypothetical protein KBC50_01720 [Candidatus Pacebacteria bacterium]|nr:hypothetical protein [Candidatus Paceibacterota bacterium]
MKKIPLSEDAFAYRNIITIDILIIVLSVALAVFIEPLFILLALPFAYDLYNVAFYKKRTPVSVVSEIFSILP